jgi:hypothetical protein
MACNPTVEYAPIGKGISMQNRDLK